MAGEVVVTVCGNLTGDPELRWTSSGVAVATFTVASTPRTYDRESNGFKDGDPLFLRCSVWRQYAENVAESLTKGMQVIVSGRLKQRSYEKDGQQRTVIELDVEDVGPTLRFATAKVTKAQRNGSGGGNGGSNGAGSYGGQGGDWGGGVQRSGGQSRPAQDDPWATSAGARQGGYAENPPF